jgi:hypothetical protein
MPFLLFPQRAPNDQVVHLRGNNGSSYTFTTTGTNDGGLWGGTDGVYTDDSRLGKAAVHAGLLRIGETGNVTIMILSGRSSYNGSMQNGITASDYGGWSGSYKFTGTPATNPTTIAVSPDMTTYRGNNGTTYTFTVTGTNDGGVWGGADGIYTDDSKLGTAAVHAGLVNIGQTSNIKVTVLAGQSRYTGSNRNGITSKDYGSWSGSYKFVGAQNVTQSTQTTTPPAVSAPNDMTGYRGNNGTSYTFTITGTNDGGVWGGADGIYTDDSKLGTAAVHAGLVTVGQAANIKVTVLAGKSRYTGSNQHGITSNDYGSWNGSYSFGNVSQSNTSTITTSILNAPENLTAYRGNNGTLYTFRIRGTTDGSVWGGADGIYTDDSKLATAAVHAGLVREGEEANIKVRILQGQAAYRGNSRNGITTRDYGSWSGSYKFE